MGRVCDGTKANVGHVHRGTKPNQQHKDLHEDSSRYKKALPSGGDGGEEGIIQIFPPDPSYTIEMYLFHVNSFVKSHSDCQPLVSLGFSSAGTIYCTVQILAKVSKIRRIPDQSGEDDEGKWDIKSKKVPI